MDSIDLRYAGFEHSDWLKQFDKPIRKECSELAQLKIALKIILVGTVPGASLAKYRYYWEIS